MQTPVTWPNTVHPQFEVARVIGLCCPSSAILKKPVLEGSKTLICTAFDASGSLNTAARSIERAGAPAYSVNAAIGVVTTGATFCAEAVVQIARQKARISVRFLVIGNVLLNPRLGLGKSLAG